MEEKSPLQLPTSLLTRCKLTICDEIASDDGKLNSFLTNTLKFKITEVEPLVIEKDYPSLDDINKLLEALNNLQHSHNSKDYKSVENPRDSIELDQKKVDIPCHSSAQKSSLQSVDENRQLTVCSILNSCDGNSTYEVVSQQAQGSNDDISDLTNIFHSLNVNDVPNDHDHVQELNKSANNLSGNTLPEPELENKNIAHLENVTSAEKQEDCQDIGEEKKRIEKTQPEYVRNQGSVAEHSSANVQNIQNTPTATVNKMKHSRGHKQEQEGQYTQYSSQYEEEMDTYKMDVIHTKPTAGKKGNSCQVTEISKDVNKQSDEEDKNEDCESGLIENSNRKAIGSIKYVESTNKIIAAQSVLTSKQSTFTQDNVTECRSLELHRDCGNKKQILKPGDLGASENHSSTDSSDSDAESQDKIIYSIKISSLYGIRMYFKGKCNDKYFDHHHVKSDGTSVTFKLRNTSEEDVSFLSKLKQIKVEECKFDPQDEICFNSAVKCIQSPKKDMIAYIKDNKVQIVGLKDSVLSAKKKLQDIVTNYKSTVTRTESLDKNSQFNLRNQEESRVSGYDKTSRISEASQKDLRRIPGGSQKSEDNEMSLSHDFNFSSSSPPEADYHREKADKTTYSRDNKHAIFSKTHGIYYVRNERRELTVQISNADITKLKVDCIVNAANKRLRHFGGVARVISEAAGPALKKECEDFILSGNQVAVTDIFVSTGGKMPAKWVMHAVGPKWEDYEAQKEEQCFEDLRHTVVRCLVEADRRGFTSIALPSISAAIFKVPKEECARCYMEAVKHFGLFMEQTSLQDIRFVDVDDTMVTIIQKHFQENWTKSCDPHIVQKDYDFAKSHIYTGNSNAATNIEKFTPSSSVSSNISGASKASSDLGSRLPVSSKVASPSEMRTGKSSSYLIGKFILRTDNRPAFNISANITITIGKPFDTLSGLHDFNVSSNQKEKEGTKNIYKLYEVSNPKGFRSKKLCALLPEPDDAEAIKKSIQNLEAVIQSPNHKMFTETVKNVVLTSSILYNEPYNKQKKNQKCTYDRKKVGHFAKYLFEYLQRASGVTASTITVVGSEDALQNICKVIESRGVKKISPEASSSSYQGGGSRRGDDSDHQQSSHRGDFDDKRHDNEASSSSNHGAIGRGSTRTFNSDRQQTNSPPPARSFSDDKQYRVSSSSNYGATGRSSTRGDNSDHQQSNSPPHARSLSVDKQYGSKNAGSSVDLDTCKICFDQKANHFLGCCGNYLCQDCEKKMGNCPYCRRLWRVLIGDQPPGTMAVRALHNSGFWEINYSFPSGRQEACHPNPGARYTGMNRTAYLPMNNDGLHVLTLLRIAFLRKLTFTIGHSLTTDRENSVIWNDIHLKTSLHGGPHGYPDPSYFLRVTQELANKGVTFDTISAYERTEIDYFENRILNSGSFTDYHPR